MAYIQLYNNGCISCNKCTGEDKGRCRGGGVGHIKAKYSAYIFTTYFLQQVLTLIAFNYVW